ncbi:hypothetical protein D8674_026594 [Pyrus ussuriensis x Pyrus communis]|uniref:Uncharacterized protein n=1 Tax=Pyrus ussuriensis x Pyrus communis TaxID=2448454 RepID=A0A5N5IEC2_9ROSA|nr:hypothetical protein D8674_026594 [Pyrus ussuriensis x Pyrus communis]
MGEISSKGKKKAVTRLRNMTLRERCLEAKRTIYAKEKMHEVPIAYQEFWDYMEEISKAEKKAMIVKTEEGS